MSPLYSIYNTLGILWVGSCTLCSLESPSRFSKVHGTVLPGLPWWFYCTVHWWFVSLFKRFNSHVGHLWLTLQWLQHYGVKIKVKKCQLLRYLSRIVAADGYRLDSNNVQSVTELVKQKPKTLGQVRKLLGMVGYFRKDIANFSKKAAQLYKLLKKTTDSKNSSKSSVTWK